MREDIFEGLKIATSKGESLQQAMQSFYNAGCKKEEIEEAARALQMYQAGHPIVQPEPAKQIKEVQEVPAKEKPQSKFQQLLQKIKLPSKTKTEQIPEKPKKEKLVIILLGAVLFLLLFALIGVLIFKKDIVSFLTGKIIDIFS